MARDQKLLRDADGSPPHLSADRKTLIEIDRER